MDSLSFVWTGGRSWSAECERSPSLRAPAARRGRRGVGCRLGLPRRRSADPDPNRASRRCRGGGRGPTRRDGRARSRGPRMDRLATRLAQLCRPRPFGVLSASASWSQRRDVHNGKHQLARSSGSRVRRCDHTPYRACRHQDHHDDPRNPHSAGITSANARSLGPRRHSILERGRSLAPEIWLGCRPSRVPGSSGVLGSRSCGLHVTSPVLLRGRTERNQLFTRAEPFAGEAHHVAPFQGWSHLTNRPLPLRIVRFQPLPPSPPPAADGSARSAAHDSILRLVPI